MSGRVAPSENAVADERMWAVLEHSSLPMWIFELGSLRFVEVNAAAVALYGYSRAEFMARTALDIIAPVHREDARRALAPGQTRGGYIGLRPHVRRDGSLLWVDVHSQPVVFHGQPARWSTLIDRTFELRAKEAAARERALLAAEIEACPDAVVMFDPEGRIVGFNGRLLQEWHTDADTLRALTLEDTLRAAQQHLVDATRETELPAEGAAETLRAEIQWKDGRISERFATILRDADGTPLGHTRIFRDVTEARRAVRALQASEARLKVLLAGAKGVAFEFDEDRRYLGIWATDESLLAQPRAECLGRTIREVLGESADELFAKPIAQVFATGEPRTIEYSIQTLGGERWFEADVSLVPLESGARRTVAFIKRDVTERKRSAEALASTERSFRALIEQSPDGILVRRGPTVAYVNSSLLHSLGMERPEEALGRNVFEWVHEADRARTAARLREADERGLPLAPAEFRCIRRDGETVHFESTSMAVSFEGRPAALVIMRDLTERKQLQARMMVSDRLATMGTLAAGVAHEINNPLSFVATNLSFALSEVEEAVKTGDRDGLQEVCSALAEGMEGCRRVQTIARDLKTFARGGEDQRAAVDVRRVMESAINIAWTQIRHKARLVKLFDEVPAVYANEGRLGQVFLNLLVNATQAMDETSADRNVLRVEIREEGGKVRIAVSDTGTGIAAAVLPRIFDPFFTTKPQGTGTGLGLSICHDIVRSHGGRLTARSEPGEGATFVVELPVEAPAVAESRSPLPSGPRARVVVVGDERSISRVLVRALGTTHDAEWFLSAREVIERIEAGEKWDAIVYDDALPELSGSAFFEQLRTRAPDQAARLVYLCDDVPPGPAREFLERARWRLEKPIDVPALRRVLADLVEALGAGASEKTAHRQGNWASRDSSAL